MRVALKFQDISTKFPLKFQDSVVVTDGGYDRGYESGYKEGFTEGDTVGYERGVSEGEVVAMQRFIDARENLAYLYGHAYNTQTEFSINGSSLEWLTKVDLSKFKNARYMFYEKIIKGVLPLFDTSNIENMDNMFQSNSQLNSWTKSVFLEIPKFNTSKVKTMPCMFQYRQIANFPQFDYSNVTSASSMFYGTKWKEPLILDTFELPKATGVSSLFRDSNIQEFNLLNFPAATSIEYMFSSCSSLTRAGTIKAKQGVSIGTSSLFQQCSNLIEVEKIDVHASSGYYTFYSCSKLESIGYMDVRWMTSASSMFYNCKALTNITLKNIKCNLQVGSGTSYGHLLTVDSLVGLCYELRDTGSVKTLTVGSANLAKLANVYVHEIPITDAMRAEDDLIDEKLPFEVCDSTADGAMLISDYVLLKNWKLA